ncbi:MAG: cellulase family glycosylhydrolase [Bacteroidales bacterium]|jgi:hypothetical protein|nr:cellulase family glycosylhydrolase [Bacteroidales bacterium]
MNLKKILVFAITIVLSSCLNPPLINDCEKRPDLSNSDFIYLKDNHFELHREKFFPIMLNYCVSFKNIDNYLIVSSYYDEQEFQKKENITKNEIENSLRGHFQLIKEMGFNCLRVTFDRSFFNNGILEYANFSIEKDYEIILAGFEEFINIAKEADLRIMFLLKPPFDESIKKFTCKILDRFKDNPTIFAYDFINEPLYFDILEIREKIDAYKLQLEWKNMMRTHAPNQMITIGFSEPIEILEWDPAISPVDFLCFHTYHPLRVKNEIYWYSKYTDKPWMIGETALPADGDSISYAEQKSFAKEVFEYAIDCGAAGIAWWDFKEDLSQSSFEAEFTGILNHTGTTTTQKGRYTIPGTVKPVAEEFVKLKDYQSKNRQIRPVNYYNNLGYNNFVIKGKIINKKTKEPVEGAVIRGWSEYWEIAWNTYSDENGIFTLYSNEQFVHFEISAPKMTKTKFDLVLEYDKITNGSYDIHNLPNKEAEYQKISYKPFLKENTSSVFDFEESKFTQAKYEAVMPTIYLSPLKIK